MNMQPINAGPTMNDSDTSFKPLFDAEPAPAQDNLVFDKPTVEPVSINLPVIETAAAKNSAGLGAQLRAKREELGLSIDQVSGQLYLAPRQVKALEADDYEALPGMASVRGFVRSYAKLLKMAPEPLLAILGSPVDTPLIESASMRRAMPTQFLGDSRLPIMGSQGRSKGKWLLIPVVILVLLALIGIYQKGWLFSVLGSSAPHAAADGAAKGESASSSTSLPESVDPVNKSLSPDGGVAAPAEVKPEPPPAPPPVALEIKFREDSWIELRRNDGSYRNSIITAHVGKAGTTETFDQDDARSLTVGNAKGVEIMVHGAPLDLGASANGNVVRINLK